MTGEETQPQSAEIEPRGGETQPQSAEIEPRGEEGFDLVAAQVRADAADTSSFFRVLASKLADALGERVRLERSGGLLKRDRPVTGIELDLTAAGAGTVLSARSERGGVVACTVARKVRGIVLSSKPVPMSEWVEELVTALSEEAERSEQTWKSLHGLLS
jgi:ATP phosphoribosyltransferase regulatory subunit HisZ